MTHNQAIELLARHCYTEDLIRFCVNMLINHEKMSQILNDNIHHVEPEIIDSFPSGNVYMGMTNHDMVEIYKLLAEIDEYKEVK